MPYLAPDTETTGLGTAHRDLPFAISACDSEGHRFLWEFDVDPKTRIPIYPTRKAAEVRRVFNSYPALVFHHAKFDIHGLHRSIFKSQNLYDSHEIHDTAVAAHVLGEPAINLAALSMKYLEALDTEEVVLKKITHQARTFARSRKLNVCLGDSPWQDYWLPKYLAELYPTEVPSHWRTILAKYAVEDAVHTCSLHPILQAAISYFKFEDQYRREMSAVEPVAHMERVGIHYRASVSRKRRLNIEKEIGKLTLYFARKLGREKFSLNSSKDLQAVLFDYGGLPVVKWTPGGETQGPQRSTDAHVLAVLSDEYPHDATLKRVKRFKELEAARRQTSTYEKHTTKHSLIHSTFNTVGLKTTRFSSQNPNDQNISKNAAIPIRDCFGPRKDHYILDVDYDQLEIRIFAVVSQEPAFINALAEGRDTHALTTKTLAELSPRDVTRQDGKRTNFAWIYGAKPRKLAVLYAVDGREFDRRMRKKYPGAVQYMAKASRQARRTGYVHTLYGYRLPVERNEAYKSVNYIVQGTAGDLLKNALILCYDYLRDNNLQRTIYPVLTVHDEILFEFHKDSDPQNLYRLTQLMEEAGNSIGVYTPTDAVIIRRDWAHPTPFHTVYPKHLFNGAEK